MPNDKVQKISKTILDLIGDYRLRLSCEDLRETPRTSSQQSSNRLPMDKCLMVNLLSLEAPMRRGGGQYPPSSIVSAVGG